VEEKLEDVLFRRAGEFNERTRRNPHHLQTWIEFVAFQDEYMPLVKAEGPIIEKKISILQRALELNPGSIVLLSTLLSLCQKAWEYVLLIAM